MVVMKENTDNRQAASHGKIVVIGGTGLIGRNVVAELRALGHEVIAASPSTGVNTLTGEGLAEAMDGARIVIDVANSPSFADQAVMDFFVTAGNNILSAARTAGVRQIVALSVVGTDRLPESGYFRAKLAQENLIRESGIPYTILRATQFFEFVGAIAQAASAGCGIRVSPAMMQPILSSEVASTVTSTALAAPANGVIEVAGPEPIRMDDLVRRHLAAHEDTREVVTDPAAGYFGTPVDDRSLTPGAGPILGHTRFAEWLSLAPAD